MANPEHLDILLQGVKAWNTWRHSNPTVKPDIGATVLHDLRLDFINLRRADVTWTSFKGSSLAHANFSDADLRNVNLSDTNLYNADFSAANLTGANLSYANLRRAILRRTNLSFADLLKANLEQCEFGHTILVNTEIADSIGLQACIHATHSFVDIHTLSKFDRIPEEFLLGSGLSDTVLTYLPHIFKKYLKFYSCFISYSSKDTEFVEILHKDLRANGVSCWFAPNDLKIGAAIRDEIDESIHLHDKLLLVLSDTSIRSQWVEQEVETALATEREQGRAVIFPVMLDDTIMDIKTGWPKYIRNTRNIGDFTNWRDRDSYERGFDKLLRDLRAEERKL